MSIALRGVSKQFGEFAAVESLLGGSWSALSDVRGNPAASVDAADLTSGEVTEWISGLPVGPGVELHVAWVADRTRLGLPEALSGLLRPEAIAPRCAEPQRRVLEPRGTFAPQPQPRTHSIFCGPIEKAFNSNTP